MTNRFKNLLRNKNIKKTKPTFKYFSYNTQQLKEHLESLFEPWMNWNNHGAYNPKLWNDNDISTWKWNIDHIIPISTFDMSKEEDIEKCWSLENLRPYSAKQNILDGTIRTRHKIN